MDSKSGGLRVVDVEPDRLRGVVRVSPEGRARRSWLVTDPLGWASATCFAGRDRLPPGGKHGLAELLERSPVRRGTSMKETSLYLAEAAKAATERVERRLGDAAKLLPRRCTRAARRRRRTPRARRPPNRSRTSSGTYAALESVFGWMVSLP